MSGNNDREHGAGSGESPQFSLDFLGLHGSGDSGEGAPPLIRRSARARRLSIRVFPDARVEVVVPPRAGPRDVQEFLGAHREWIDSKRAHALRSRPDPQVFPPPAMEFAATGERWRLHIAGGRGALRVIERGEPSAGVLSVMGDGTPDAIRSALRGWLLRAARARLTPLVAALSASAGIPYSRVSIRRQRSRWGSCSVRGTISLNACLLFQRRAVVDYLLVHELTHVRHMNHSPRFWQAVERNCADWRVLDRELTQGWRNVPRWVFSDT